MAAPDITTLGKQVLHDRTRHGWTQEVLARHLSESQDAPVDAVTGNKRKVSRNWVLTVEAGDLKRDLPTDVRRWLARTLKSSEDLYAQLPLNETQAGGELSGAPPLRGAADAPLDLVWGVLRGLQSGSLVQVDTPTTGPLSTHAVDWSFALVAAITHCDAELAIFSNEYPPENTKQCVATLIVTVAEILKQHPPASGQGLAEYFDEKLQGQDICAVGQDVFRTMMRGGKPEKVRLEKAGWQWVKDHLSVYLLDQLPEAERYNPMSVALIDGKRAFLIATGEPPKEITDSRDIREVAKCFQRRQRLFRAWDYTEEQIAEIALTFSYSFSIQ